MFGSYLTTNRQLKLSLGERNSTNRQSVLT